MALVKPEDIKSLNEKKEHLTSILESTSVDNAKTLKGITESLDLLEVSKQTAIDNNPANENSIKDLIDILNKKLSVPATAKSTYLTGDNKYAFGGDDLFEVIDTTYQEANEDNWTVTRASYDQYIAQQNEQIGTEAETAHETALGSITSELEQEAFNDSFADLNAAFEAATKETAQRTVSQHRYEFTDKLANDYITNNIDNSELLIRFEKEKAEREEAIRDSFKRQNKKPSLLKDSHTEVTDEKVSIEADTEYLKSELKKIMGVDGEGEDGIIKDTLSQNKESQLIFKAEDAIVLTRKSLFDLTIGDINGKIKAACNKGETKIKLTGDEVSGTQIYALLDAGYKVTHGELKTPGRNKDNTLYTIDWTYSTPN